MRGGILWQFMDGHLGLSSDGSGSPVTPHRQPMQSPVSAHLHLFAGVPCFMLQNKAKGSHESFAPEIMHPSPLKYF